MPGGLGTPVSGTQTPELGSIRAAPDPQDDISVRKYDVM